MYFVLSNKLIFTTSRSLVLPVYLKVFPTFELLYCVTFLHYNVSHLTLKHHLLQFKPSIPYSNAASDIRMSKLRSQNACNICHEQRFRSCLKFLARGKKTVLKVERSNRHSFVFCPVHSFYSIRLTVELTVQFSSQILSLTISLIFRNFFIFSTFSGHL